MTTQPTRIADVVSGHVHPSLAITDAGDLLAIYNREGGGGKELLVCRSSDAGVTWSAPEPIAAIRECSIYPGSVTRFGDGRLLLNFACYRTEPGEPWREAQYSWSEDGGRSWSAPHSYPVPDGTNYTCMRNPVLQLSPTSWVCPFYDRTVVYDADADTLTPFGDGRNHGMVPITATPTGTIVSGAPQADAPVPVGPPGDMVRGLRSTDGGRTWDALGVFPHFGVAGQDLITLADGRLLLTYIQYGIGHDGEYAFALGLSADDGCTWDLDEDRLRIYSPGRRVMGRGWPRTVQLDADHIGTIHFDLDADQPGGPGLFYVGSALS